MPAQTTPGLPDPAAAVRFATALAKAPGLAELERVVTDDVGQLNRLVVSSGLSVIDAS